MQAFKLFVLVLLYCVPLCSLAQKPQQIDSQPNRKQLDTLVFHMAKVLKGDSINKAFRDSVLKAGAVQNPKRDSVTPCDCQPAKDGRVADAGSWVLVFLPAILLTILLLWIFNSKGLKNFRLKEALSENQYPAILVDNPQYNSTNLTNAALVGKENLEEILPPTIEKTYLVSTTTVVPGTNPPVSTTTQVPPMPSASISRYIAFITSMLTLAVALALVCFYIYHYIRTGCPPELTGVSMLLIALGIGTVPYVVNKMSAAIGKSKADSTQV